jgi:hypothetical protein
VITFEIVRGSGRIIRSGSPSPVRFHLPGTSTAECPLTRFVALSISSPEKIESDVATLAAAAAIAKPETHGSVSKQPSGMSWMGRAASGFLGVSPRN